MTGTRNFGLQGGFKRLTSRASLRADAEAGQNQDTQQENNCSRSSPEWRPESAFSSRLRGTKSDADIGNHSLFMSPTTRHRCAESLEKIVEESPHAIEDDGKIGNEKKSVKTRPPTPYPVAGQDPRSNVTTSKKNKQEVWSAIQKLIHRHKSGTGKESVSSSSNNSKTAVHPPSHHVSPPHAHISEQTQKTLQPSTSYDLIIEAAARQSQPNGETNMFTHGQSQDDEMTATGSNAENLSIINLATHDSTNRDKGKGKAVVGNPMTYRQNKNENANQADLQVQAKMGQRTKLVDIYITARDTIASVGEVSSQFCFESCMA